MEPGVKTHFGNKFSRLYPIAYRIVQALHSRNDLVLLKFSMDAVSFQ